MSDFVSALSCGRSFSIVVLNLCSFASGLTAENATAHARIAAAQTMIFLIAIFIFLGFQGSNTSGKKNLSASKTLCPFKRLSPKFVAKKFSEKNLRHDNRAQAPTESFPKNKKARHRKNQQRPKTRLKIIFSNNKNEIRKSARPRGLAARFKLRIYFLRSTSAPAYPHGKTIRPSVVKSATDGLALTLNERMRFGFSTSEKS